VPTEIEEDYGGSADEDYADSKRRANRRIFFQALAIAGGLAVVVGVILVIAGGSGQNDGQARQREAAQVRDNPGSREASSADESQSERVRILLTVVAVIGATLLAALFVGGIVLITGIVSACPVCGKWWASISVRRTVLDQSRGYGLVTRQSHTDTSGRISEYGDILYAARIGTSSKRWN
jgi:hypothetical protein